jgi:hypothetical protein
MEQWDLIKPAYKSRLVRFFFCAAIFLACAMLAWSGPCFLCRKPSVDMPISLAIGTVRTPEFPVKHEAYEIYIEEEWRLPAGEQECMTGGVFPGDPNHCGMFHFDRLLDADWTIRDGERIVARGSVHDYDSDYGTSQQYLDRYLGMFVGEKNKKYVLEVKFMKDGTPLNITNPHLVVMMSKPSDMLP